MAGTEFSYLLSHTHALVPRLGMFGDTTVPSIDFPQSSVPYDYDELIASIAPSPVLLYAPLRNRFANAVAVKVAAVNASAAWGEEKTFTFVQPDAPSDFQDSEVTAAVNWVSETLSHL